MKTLPRILLITAALLCIAPALLAQGVSFTTVDYPGASRTRLLGMNNRGQFVGDDFIASRPDAKNQGFLWDKGKFLDIAPPGASFNQAKAVNDSGNIAGYF